MQLVAYGMSVGGGGERMMGGEERYRLHVGCTEESRASTSTMEQVTLGRSLRAGTRAQH